MKYMLLIYDDEKAWAKLSVGCNWELVAYCRADWSCWANCMYSPMACCRCAPLINAMD